MIAQLLLLLMMMMMILLLLVFILFNFGYCGLSVLLVLLLLATTGAVLCRWSAVSRCSGGGQRVTLGLQSSNEKPQKIV